MIRIKPSDIALAVVIALVFGSFLYFYYEKKQEAFNPPLEAVTQEVEPQEPTPTYKSLGTFTLTAYCPCYQCCGQYALNRPVDKYGNMIVYTASSTVAEAGRTIAVDPSVIPLGSEVIIEGDSFIAEDTGGAIKGKRIDIYFPPDAHYEAQCFGVQEAEIYVKEDKSE